jgi:hypothetical protein
MKREIFKNELKIVNSKKTIFQVEKKSISMFEK